VSRLTNDSAAGRASYLQAINDASVVLIGHVDLTNWVFGAFTTLLFLVSIAPDLYWRGRAIAETWQPSWL
jgi:hypothetical protein